MPNTGTPIIDEAPAKAAAASAKAPSGAPTTADMYRVFCLLLEEAKKQTATLEHVLGLLELQGKDKGTTPAGPVIMIATDAELDSQYGNPEVKAKSPRDWTGDSMTGRRFSQCPPDYLDLVAARLEYFAATNATSAVEDDRKKAKYNRLDAARARGWAKRIRDGYVSPTQPATGVGVNPFEDAPVVF